MHLRQLLNSLKIQVPSPAVLQPSKYKIQVDILLQRSPTLKDADTGITLFTTMNALISLD